MTDGLTWPQKTTLQLRDSAGFSPDFIRSSEPVLAAAVSRPPWSKEA